MVRCTCSCTDENKYPLKDDKNNYDHFVQVDHIEEIENYPEKF